MLSLIITFIPLNVIVILSLIIIFIALNNLSSLIIIFIASNVIYAHSYVI